jgi:outer membrane protein
MLALPGLAAAQSLQELYDAARAYDATYLAARPSASLCATRYSAEAALDLAAR